MNVPFIDFSQQYEKVKEEISTGLNQVFEKGNFILGQPVNDFEGEFAKFCDAKYAIGVNSGTDALYLALSALDIKPGDEVILPAHTFIATALCISYTGAKPVLADIEDETYNLDPKKLKSVITQKTKALIPVHLYGQSADMDELRAIAKEYNVAIVEDACQSHGAKYKGTRVGSLGDVGCFSFYPTKSLGAFGDGGIIVTSREDIYEKVKMLRDYGRKNRYDHTIKGYNSRLDTVQAVVLSAKLKHLDMWNKMRSEAASIYCDLLKDTQGISAPVTNENNTHVFQTFAVRVKNRDQVLEEMKNKGIGVLIHYPIPIHLQEAYQDLNYSKGSFPVSEEVADTILSLPMFPHITKEQVKYVADSLKESVNQLSGV